MTPYCLLACRTISALAAATIALWVAGCGKVANSSQVVPRTDEEICITEGSSSLGVDAADAERLVAQLGSKLGLASLPKVLACRDVQKAQAYYLTVPADRAGEYLLFNPTWVREVIGQDSGQAVALFAHELGHFFNRDFYPPRSKLSREVRERSADEFAGCALFHFGVPFSSLEALLSRLRNDRDLLYPNRLESLAAADKGYTNCANRGTGSSPKETDATVVTIVGPLSGPYSDFGYSHARGILAAISHYMERACGLDPLEMEQYFDFRLVDEWPILRSLDSKRALLDEAVKGSDIIFGPQTSELAEHWLLDPPNKLDTTVILTTAATPRVKEHEQFGVRLLQFAPNIDAYVEQMLVYLDRFAATRTSKIGILYRDDAYGRSAYQAAVRGASRYGWKISSVSFASEIGFHSSAELAEIRRIVQSFVERDNLNSEGSLLFMVDAGTRLPVMLTTLNSSAPRAVVATPSSVPIEQLATVPNLRAVVPYSYYDGVYTLTTLEFLNASEIAEQLLRKLSGVSLTASFPKVNTVDAEDHDAALFWLQNHPPRAFDGICAKNTGNMYVTNFRVETRLGRQVHEGNLYLFELANGRAVPAQLKPASK